MLPTDVVIIKDKEMRVWAKKYAEDQDLFFSGFSKVLVKLFELGVPFTSGEDSRIVFKRTE
ncbi:hypothetical protein AC579_4161 [Pseudocercospora musae]|uniref:Uncharacterized protein n=1 Tax=Pseudocercospora musae TaxID=113226 RepID=A0A139IFL6_9PEZI|nr:hypothetical protein AC579_4161 [Pseudocercospora musae]